MAWIIAIATLCFRINNYKEADSLDSRAYLTFIYSSRGSANQGAICKGTSALGRGPGTRTIGPRNRGIENPTGPTYRY
jgi:hypothetical protein